MCVRKKDWSRASGDERMSHWVLFGHIQEILEEAISKRFTGIMSVVGKDMSLHWHGSYLQHKCNSNMMVRAIEDSKNHKRLWRRRNRRKPFNDNKKHNFRSWLHPDCHYYRHYLAEVFLHSLCSSDVFVMIYDACVALIYLLVLYEVWWSQIDIYLMINKNSILSMKVKHLVWKNHTSSSMILGYVVYIYINIYNIVCSHSTAVENDPVYMLIITFFCLWCLFSFSYFLSSVWSLCVSFCLEVTLATWLCLTNRNTLSVCCVWFV